MINRRSEVTLRKLWKTWKLSWRFSRYASLIQSENPVSYRPDSKSSTLRGCCPYPKTQARPHSLRRPDRVGIHLRETPTLSSSNYYTVEPSSAEGKIRNRLTSSNPSLPASELVTDLQATLDHSVTKSSSATAHPTTTVDEEEGSEDQVEGKGREGDFFDQAEFSDDQVDDDG